MTPSRKKYYGVRVGLGGPRVYRNWPDVNGYPNSQFKGFVTSGEAESWVQEWISKNGIFQPLSPSDSASVTPSLRNMDYEADQNLAQPECLQESDNEARSPGYRSESTLRCRIPEPTASSSFIPIPKDEEEDSCVTWGDVNDSDKKSPALGSVENKELGRPILTNQQLQVLERARRGENIFFTGSAGTGKSVLLREIIDVLGGPSEQLSVTASTGIAGLNIGGTTLHSFAGIGLGKEPIKKLVGKIMGQKPPKLVWSRWRNTRTLVIDEISMIDGVLFDKLESIARQLRDNNLPFGGIQLVLSGDFCQLPPVPDLHDGVQLPVTFAFDASSWDSCIGTPIVLNKVFRQRDRAFVRMLDEMRYGRLDDGSAECFAALCRSVVYDDGIEPTELFPLRREVQAANASRLSSLSEPSHTYVSSDVPGIDIRGHPITPQQAEKLLDRLVSVKSLTLKVGAQVMLIKNLAQGSLVNGSIGRVIAFKSAAEAQKDANEIAKVDSSQDSNSKLKSHSSIQNKRGIGEVGNREMDKISGGSRVWPLVRFTNGREVLCVPLEFSVENVNGATEVRRDQVPLILAWALSVHKSQGQTIERVKVDLGRTFEKGQAYVALSRATNMETLQVLNFDRSKVMAHPRVLEWHANLVRKLDEEEEEAILRVTDNEETMKAFFEDDDMCY
ncbi:hypothetical protein M0805_008358 [Coniferiporia weirii]|nr:hypothetical protein M0805_008358 [Coniferiporia weirii]